MTKDSKSSEYINARDTRKKGVLGNITESLLSGDSIGSSIKQGISATTKAKAVGLSEKFDSLNIAKMFSGNIGVALMGRLRNRSKEDMHYFMGKDIPALSEESELSNVEKAFYTNIMEGQKKKLQVKDSIADVSAKIYNLMRNQIKDDKLQNEIEADFEVTKHNKEKARHEKLMKEIEKAMNKEGDTKEFRSFKKELTKVIKKLDEVEDAIDTYKLMQKVKDAASLLGRRGFKGLGLKQVATGTAILGMSSAATMSTTQYLQQKEGVKLKAYVDSTGVSIGYGHQIKAEEYKQGYIQIGGDKIPIKGDRGLDTTITQEQANKLLDIDLPKYEERAAKPLGEAWNKLNDNQKKALISYAYNVGSTQNLVNAGLATAINEGDMKSAADIMREYGIKTSGGGKPDEKVATRREEEAKLFELSSKDTKPVKDTVIKNEKTSYLQISDDVKKILNQVKENKVSSIDNTVTTGTNLQNSSVKNQDIKKTMQTALINVNNNTTVINSGSNRQQILSYPTEYDYPVVVS